MGNAPHFNTFKPVTSEDIETLGQVRTAGDPANTSWDFGPCYALRMRIKNTSTSFTRAFVSTLAAAALTLGLAGCASDTPFQKEPTAKPTASASESEKPAEEPEVEKPAVEETEEAPVEPTTDAPEDPAPDAEPEITDQTAQIAALEAYAQAERDSVASIFDLYPGVYDSVEVFTAPTGSLSFEYTYTQAMDKDAALEYFEGIKDQLMAQSNQTVFPAMRVFDINGPLDVTYTYLNPDGTLLWEHTFFSN